MPPACAADGVGATIRPRTLDPSNREVDPVTEAVDDPAGTETQVEPLSDESLEEVAGGICSFMCCSGDMNDTP